MNPIELMKNAEKLSVQQLQQAVESGTLPAYIGVPLIQEKVKQQQQMQTAAAGQQGPQATVKDQIMQQAGVTQLPSGLPEEYADGGIVGFAKGGGMPRSLSEQLEELIAEQQAEEFRKQGWTEEAIKNYQSKGRIDSMSRRNLATMEQPYNPVTSGPTLREKMTRAAMNARQGEGVIEMPPYQERVNVSPSQAARDLVAQSGRGFGAAPDYAGAVEGELLVPEAQQVAGALPRPTTTVNGVSFEMPSSTPRADYAADRAVYGYRPLRPEAEAWNAARNAEVLSGQPDWGARDYLNTLGDGKAPSDAWAAGDDAYRAIPKSLEKLGGAAKAGIKGLASAAGPALSAYGTAEALTRAPELSSPVDLIDPVNLMNLTGSVAGPYTLGEYYPAIAKGKEAVHSALMHPIDTANKALGRQPEQTPGRVPTRDSAKGYGKDLYAEKQAAAREYVNTVAQRYPNIDPNMIMAIIEQESRYNPRAKNPESSAKGLMQVIDGTAKEMGYTPEDQYNPLKSVETGMKRFAQGYERSGGDPFRAITLYYDGVNKKQPSADAIEYANKVMERYQRLTGKTAAELTKQPVQFGTSRVPPAELESQGIEALAAQQAAPQAQGSDMSGIEQALAANMYSADETDPAKIAAQYKAMIGDDKGIAALRDKIASMEAKQASAEEKAPWLALMQAGLATMAGTSPYAAVNIGQGMQTGLEAYTKSQADAEKDELQRYKLEAELANAQRELDISVATKGIESADARRKFNKVTDLETKRFMINQQQEDRRIGLQERTTAVAERRQNRYDMIEEQAQRFMAENPNMPSTEAYAKAAQMFPTGGTSSISAEMRAETARTNKRNSLVKELAGLGFSKEDQLRKEQIRQQLAALDAESRLGRQAPAPSGTTSGWSNFQQVSR